MSSYQLAEGLPCISVLDDMCASCQIGKMHRKSFPINKAGRASQKLELIHSDDCGPMQTPSLSGNKYFVVFIVDYTRMV